MTRYNYQKFIDFLNIQIDVIVKITYSQMEDLLEKKLPKSAYKYQAYFSNSDSHVISAIWFELGYTQIELVLGEYLVLKKLKE
ncbi:MAG: hypothetical protein RSB50_08885 [Cetobacterium sp.]